MSLFAERGYADVTVEDIAHEAGISERTFFRYFASKDHLLVAEASRRIDVIHESLAQQDERSTRGRRCGTRCSTSRRARTQFGRNAAIWAHLTKEAPALLAKMIMHGALEGTHNIEVELARRLGVPATDALPDVMMRVTLAAVQSAYLRWLEDDGAESLTDLTADALDLVGGGLARGGGQITLRPYSSFHHRAFATSSGSLRNAGSWPRSSGVGPMRSAISRSTGTSMP